MLEKKPEIFTFEGAGEGPSLVVFGAVHGNEKCGTEAITRVIAHIKAGKIKILNGKLTMVPICNPRAYDQNVRFTERNLNRFFFPKDKPEKYEDYLDNILCPVAAAADYMIDLHSYTSQGAAFIFLDDMKSESAKFAKSLGVPRFVCGWETSMQQSGDVVDKKQAMGTTEYARSQGAIALTLECGNHTSPRNADVGFEAILNALEYLKMAEVAKDIRVRDLPDEGSYAINMKAAYLKTREGDFTQDWQNMDTFKKGTVIARYDDGEEITMPVDGFIVLPKRDTMIGHEWFYWGVEDKI